MSRNKDEAKEAERVAALKEQGVDVCDLQCLSCKRRICTAANTTGRVTKEPAGALMDTPEWWMADDMRAAIVSTDGHLDGCHGQCEGDFTACPLPGPNCVSVRHCRWCAWWESKDGVRGVCQDPAYDGERKRTLRADHNLCCQFVSRWSSESQIAEGDKHFADIDRVFRVTCVRHGETGDETHYLRAFDEDGDFSLRFDSDVLHAWAGSAEKAGILVALVRTTTGDTSSRVEEVL